ncbi:hypothetical protein ER308_06860 [Egibacter rhizosphaerae]|uniref:Resuscitation-promoting factor core lysozyme-like domain-containing protein n=1 Tax=Egibacter rhizosphaerae TaxID=1670831 RepID=A0A411YL95_9ACTN|nr:hypothetical protein ER308_06860 [Egibacter rhizosphaerae]
MPDGSGGGTNEQSTEQSTEQESNQEQSTGGGDSGSASAPSASTGVWDRLAECESNGNWSINTGNGFYGGLQFHPQTWAAYGGHEFAPNAHQATREQEIAIAERVLEGQGWGAWPACSSQLGLR